MRGNSGMIRNGQPGVYYLRIIHGRKPRPDGGSLHFEV